jgi:hypothetical protein
VVKVFCKIDGAGGTLELPMSVSKLIIFLVA